MAIWSILCSVPHATGQLPNDFSGKLSVVEEVPQPVTTDGHDSYPRAVREMLGSDVEHRDNTYLNRQIEQDYCGNKQRYRPRLAPATSPDDNMLSVVHE
jgi:transposase-like protein